MSFKFLEHTSDIGVDVNAATMEEALTESIDALLNLIFNKNRKEINLLPETGETIINIKSPDYESLLIDILNEVIYLIDAEKYIPQITKVLLKDNYSVELNISKKKSTDIILYVKAATYHQLRINKNNNHISIRYFVDI